MAQINFYFYCLVLSHNEVQLGDKYLADFTFHKT